MGTPGRAQPHPGLPLPGRPCRSRADSIVAGAGTATVAYTGSAARPAVPNGSLRVRKVSTDGSVALSPSDKLQDARGQLHRKSDSPSA